MITVHHLADSRRSGLCGCEELGIDYTLKLYPRANGMFSPPQYQALHGLVKRR